MKKILALLLLSFFTLPNQVIAYFGPTSESQERMNTSHILIFVTFVITNLFIVNYSKKHKPFSVLAIVFFSFLFKLAYISLYFALTLVNTAITLQIFVVLLVLLPVVFVMIDMVLLWLDNKTLSRHERLKTALTINLAGLAAVLIAYEIDLKLYESTGK